MGEAHKDAFQLDFDSRLKLEFHGTKVTSDAGRWFVGMVGESGVLTYMLDFLTIFPAYYAIPQNLLGIILTIEMVVIYYGT